MQTTFYLTQPRRFSPSLSDPVAAREIFFFHDVR